MILPEKAAVNTVSHMSGNNPNLIGAILVSAGKLTVAQVEQVLRSQKDVGLLFGDAAIRLGFVRPQDVEQALARQFEYPYLIPGQNKISRDVVAAYNPFSPEVDLLRAARSQLLTRWFGDQVERKALAVISHARGDGRSYVAANLAVVFSQLGQRTLLIDADMRNPRQHLLFGIGNGVGLSSVLSGRAGAEAISRIPDLIDLSVLTAGPTPPNPGDLVARAHFSTHIEQAIKSYDAVIVDTPAASLGNDAHSIGHRARAALLVVRKDRTRFDVVQRMTTHFASAGVHVLGALLNEI